MVAAGLGVEDRLSADAAVWVGEQRLEVGGEEALGALH